MVARQVGAIRMFVRHRTRPNVLCREPGQAVPLSCPSSGVSKGRRRVYPDLGVMDRRLAVVGVKHDRADDPQYPDHLTGDRETRRLAVLPFRFAFGHAAEDAREHGTETTDPNQRENQRRDGVPVMDGGSSRVITHRAYLLEGS